MLDSLKMFAAQCGGIETALISCSDTENGIWAIVGVVLDIMMIGVGAAAVIGIIISGIQYMTSSGDPGAMTKAKNRLTQVIIGILAFGLMWVFLQWLIPGGIL
ncbi:hypothetical protein IIZ77_00575 [Candidatus Saccharibacteria bacterium]|nr:hypothetical protein [Candidatus Saccharibacteria bacterium]